MKPYNSTIFSSTYNAEVRMATNALIWMIETPRMIDKFQKEDKDSDFWAKVVRGELTNEYPNHKQLFADVWKSK
jgi:hypothetical protein